MPDYDKALATLEAFKKGKKLHVNDFKDALYAVADHDTFTPKVTVGRINKLMEFLPYFSDCSYASDLLQRALHSNIEAAVTILEHANKFIKKPWAHEVIEPTVSFMAQYNTFTPIYQHSAHTQLMEKYLPLFINESYAPTVLGKLVNPDNIESTVSLLGHAEKFAHKSWAQTVIKPALMIAAEYDTYQPQYSLTVLTRLKNDYLPLYENEPYAKQLKTIVNQRFDRKQKELKLDQLIPELEKSGLGSRVGDGNKYISLFELTDALDAGKLAFKNANEITLPTLQKQLGALPIVPVAKR